MKKTKLPEKWYIKGSQKLKLFLQSSKNKISWNCVSGNAPKWGYYISIDWAAKLINNFPSDYKEISLETYKESLLNSKEIIGYKCPMDLFGGRIKKGDVFSECSAAELVMYIPNHKPFGVPSEIVKTWEPVYEQEEKIISVGGKFNVTVKNNEVWHGTDNITDFVNRMVNMSKLITFGNYQAQMSDIIWKRTGCQNVETKLSDWEKVYNEIKV